MEHELTTQEINYLVNHSINMLVLLKKLNLDVKPNGVMFCPFHENTNTPSAHYYTESDGMGSIFCFYEHRLFTNVDLFKMYCPDIDLKELAKALFNKLSSEDQENLIYNVNNGDTVDSLPYLEDLDDFKFSKITLTELLNKINYRVPLDDNSVVMNKLYELGDTTYNFDLNNKYVSLMNTGTTDYRFLSAYKVLNSGFKFPDYIISYLSSHGDCIMLPNKINDSIYSITLRNLSGEKQFLKIGNVSQFLYGLSKLPKDFHFGEPILLVEGNFDCDFIRTIYPNTLASLTNALSNNHLEIISRITNKVILAYDNDKAGNIGFYSAKKKLESLGVSVSRFTHNSKLKDFGDLYDLQFKDESEYNYISRAYRMQLDNLN